VGMCRTVACSWSRCAMALAIPQAGSVWRAWHTGYKANIDEWYVKYEAEQRAKNAGQ